MSKIQDEFSGRSDISKQRRYQLRRRRDGKCIFCGRPAVIRGKCEEHRQKLNIKDREKRRGTSGAKSRYRNSESYSFEVGKRKKQG